MTWNLYHLCISCIRLNLRRGERKPALIMKTPAHSKLPASKTFNIEIRQLWRSPNCTEKFCGKHSGVPYVSSVSRAILYTFLHLFVSLARNRTAGESTPCRSQFQRVTPSFFFPTTLCGVLVFDSVSRAPPPPPPALSHSSSLSTHTLSTYTLTHTLFVHTLFVNTLFVHIHFVNIHFDTLFVNTHFVNTLCQHTLCPHTLCQHTL